jgi:phenylpyruvate tautomerase PptA (4-oxalocrotonate tautomerase family)
MPLYDVEHVIPLSDQQQQDIANVITDLHSNRFKTPKWFVNVRFTDATRIKVSDLFLLFRTKRNLIDPLRLSAAE